MNAVLFILAALAVSALVAELVARWWLRYHSRYYVWPPGLRMKMCLDAEVLPQFDPTVRFDINRQGERGGEVPTSPGGLYRVLVAGGSQPEGAFLNQDVMWPGALQRLLEQPRNLNIIGASQVHVGCIARSGVGSEALNLIFEKVLPQYPRLQLIVVMVGASDVLRWFEQNTPVQPQPVRVSDVFRCHPEGRFGWKPRQLALGELLRRARRRWLRPVDVHPQTGHWLKKARAMRADAKTTKETTPDPTPMLAHFEHHFRRVLQQAHEHADRVLVIKQPWFRRQPLSAEEIACMWHGGVGQAWREDISTYYSLDAFTQVMSRLDERVGEITAPLGVETLDLTSSLEQSLDTYYDGFHITAKGARQVAAAVNAAILGSRRRRASGVDPVPMPFPDLSALDPEPETATTSA